MFLPTKLNYNTIVFTTYLGDQEIETVLANYDYHRNLIDYEVIAYDEIGESAYSVKSNIGFTTLTVIHRSIYEAKDEVQNYTFEENGKITQIIPTNSTISLSKTKLIHSVITQLGLDKSDIKTSLITVKILPRNPLETIVVIPQIVDQGEHYFELNSYIVIANSITGKITHKYFESAETNSWTSAAIELREIKIDTAAYLIKENTSAFGIRVYYVGMSRANPYSNETISLFEKSDNKLIKVLNTYLIMTNTGEWDTNCAGEFSETKNRLIMSKEKSNNYFDIKVKSKIVTSKNYVDKNGECDIKDSITNKTETLKYNGKAYKLKSDK